MPTYLIILSVAIFETAAWRNVVCVAIASEQTARNSFDTHLGLVESNRALGGGGAGEGGGGAGEEGSNCELHLGCKGRN